MNNILILYSNPSDTTRIRLDKEHRAIDQVISKSGINPNILFRCHATSIEDIVHILSNTNFDVIHFSGHGSNNGIYLEKTKENKSELFVSKELAELLKNTQPRLTLAIFMSFQ